jgi:hypothetical protein
MFSFGAFAAVDAWVPACCADATAGTTAAATAIATAATARFEIRICCITASIWEPEPAGHGAEPSCPASVEECPDTRLNDEPLSNVPA